MKFTDYRLYDALGLAELVARGEVSAEELLQCALERTEAVNPGLNAIIIPMHEIARQRAQEPLTGPFAGVPFLLKDIFQDYAGVPTTAGSRALRNYHPERHSSYVERCLAAGLVIFGKTNLPEFGGKPITEPIYWGATRNPWNPAHTPGGSSGGSAAAVAAGIVPMAGGNDGGGSIRIPASHCGLFGLKPSSGGPPCRPHYSELWQGAVSEHVLTRSVRDSAAMLDVLQGPESGASLGTRPPQRPYREEIGRDPGRLRIAYSTQSPLGLAVDADCVQAVEHSIALLHRLGHEVEEAEPAIDGKLLMQCNLTMGAGTFAAEVALTRERTGATDSDFELETRGAAALGRALRAGDFVRALFRWTDFARALDDFFGRYDLYLTPTVASPPTLLGEQYMLRWEQMMLKLLLPLGWGKFLQLSGLAQKVLQMSTQSDLLGRMAFTPLSNLTGTPSMSVPLYWNDSGLPIGSQFIAPLYQEARLLRLAAQLEQTQPWFGRVPQ